MPSEQATLQELKSALHARLVTVATIIRPGAENIASASNLLQVLASSVKASDDRRLAWLLFIAVSAVFPTSAQLGELLRRLSLASEGGAGLAVLEATVNPATLPGVGLGRLELVTDATVIDVNFCAKFDHNTGIQRVVRQTMPLWEAADRPMELVAWCDDATAMRRLHDYESDRVLHWNDRRLAPPKVPSDGPRSIVVPWATRVFLPEVPMASICDQLACLTESSGNAVHLIGYDAIPLVSADSQSDAESERFAHYLTIVKHAHSVSAISESAAEEFRGFCDALPAQGIAGPSVHAIPLAFEVPAVPVDATRDREHDLPLVLCVGSHEPRKNQEAVLFAAETLFREGHRFEIVFVGGGSATVLHDFDRRVRKLNSRGYGVSSLRSASDAELVSLYRRARFTVFVSLHEGYGLPVAESLALGTPALTSNFGSLAEIAAVGGCLTVDPRDDLAVLDGFRKMLSDDALNERLRVEARALVPRTWAHYADDLWTSLQSSNEVAR